MIIDNDIFNNAKQRDQVVVLCDFCKKKFPRKKKNLFCCGKLSATSFCSPTCGKSYRLNKTFSTILCDGCGNPFLKNKGYIKKYSRHFCSRSCVGKFGNANWIKSGRNGRSKIESWIEQQLLSLFPKLEIRYNDRQVLNGLELDIYIPSSKLAFELNGIFHYEPIFGQKTLEKNTQRDTNKTIECYNLGIDLCVIDISSMKYFKPALAQTYLDIIINVINERGS